MDLTRIAPKDRQHIQKYGPSGFTVSDVVYSGPALVFAKASYDWDAGDPTTLTLDHFQPVIDRASEIDLCLLGCGTRMQRVPADLRASLKEHGVAIEAMDTGAACRTFNVLLAEGRALVAAVFPTEK